MKYFVYIARCNDGTLYTGSCIDMKAREIKHNKGQGAKYTKYRRPIKIVYFEKFNSLVEALRREFQVKKLTRAQKNNLIEK